MPRIMETTLYNDEWYMLFLFCTTALFLVIWSLYRKNRLIANELVELNKEKEYSWVDNEKKSQDDKLNNKHKSIINKTEKNMNTLVKILLCSTLLSPEFSYGQDVKEGTVKIGKEKKAGFIATSKYSRDLVTPIMGDQMAEAGLKKYKKKKKFYCYKEVSMREISPNKIDVCYKVQKKKQQSRIYFVVSKGYDNYVTSATDAVVAANINAFLAKVDAAVAHNEEIKRKQMELNVMNSNLDKQRKDIKKAETDKNKHAKELESLKQVK